jgi:hypothetical protein
LILRSGFISLSGSYGENVRLYSASPALQATPGHVAALHDGAAVGSLHFGSLHLKASARQRMKLTPEPEVRGEGISGSMHTSSRSTACEEPSVSDAHWFATLTNAEEVNGGMESRILWNANTSSDESPRHRYRVEQIPRGVAYRRELTLEGLQDEETDHRCADELSRQIHSEEHRPATFMRGRDGLASGSGG